MDDELMERIDEKIDRIILLLDLIRIQIVVWTVLTCALIIVGFGVLSSALAAAP